MKISIVIPAYNAEKTIRRTLDSVLNQTYSNFQAVVVDDGSVDNTFNIIKEFHDKDSRFCLIHKENGGIGSAYQEAFKVIEGDYVTFVDSDDAIRSNLFQTIVDSVEKTNAEVIHYGIDYYDVEGKQIRQFAYEHKELQGSLQIITDFFRGANCHKNHPSLGIRAFKKELFEGFDFFNGSIGIDEVLTTWALSHADSAYFIEDKFYECTLFPNSVSRSKLTEDKVLKVLNSFEVLSNIMNIQDDEVQFWLSLKRVRYYLSVCNMLSKMFSKDEYRTLVKKEYAFFKKGKHLLKASTRCRLSLFLKFPVFYNSIFK